MLRIYLIQNLYDPSDMATVAEVINSRAFSEFCGIDSSNQVPDGDTLGRSCNLLVRNGIRVSFDTERPDTEDCNTEYDVCTGKSGSG